MEIEVSAGRITVTMPKTSSMILQYRTEEEEKPVKPKNRRAASGNLAKGNIMLKQYLVKTGARRQMIMLA